MSETALRYRALRNKKATVPGMTLRAWDSHQYRVQGRSVVCVGRTVGGWSLVVAALCYRPTILFPPRRRGTDSVPRGGGPAEEAPPYLSGLLEAF